MAKYKVIEDNGGGLTLYVFRGSRVIYSHSGYEFNPGQLTQDLDALYDGSDPRDWEGCEDDPQGSWGNITSYPAGWEVVASNENGRRKLHKAVMGRAAQIEFGVTDDEKDAAKAAVMLGKTGGSRRTDAKTAAARENGKKGGRPKKQ